MALALVGCTSLTEPPEDWGIPMSPNAVTHAAVRRATQCAKGLPQVRVYTGLRFFLVPGGSFDLDWRVSKGFDLPVAEVVIYNRIYVAEQRKDMEALWAHAMLHALWDLKGTTLYNHHPLFAECGLLVI